MCNGVILSKHLGIYEDQQEYSKDVTCCCYFMLYIQYVCTYNCTYAVSTDLYRPFFVMSEQILQICLSTFKPLQNGHTPLHQASWYGHVAVIEVLLKMEQQSTRPIM